MKYSSTVENSGTCGDEIEWQIEVSFVATNNSYFE